MTEEHVLGESLGAGAQSFNLCCDWVVPCAGLQGDDYHHSLVAEPPLCVSCVDTCGSQAHAWDAHLAMC